MLQRRWQNALAWCFTENGMRVSDVEVLGIEVNDKAINDMLNKAQHEVVGANIKLHQAEKELEVTERQEEIARKKAEAQAVTAKRTAELQEAKIAQDLSVTQAKIKAEFETAQKQKETAEAKEAVANVAAASELQRAEGQNRPGSGYREGKASPSSGRCQGRNGSDDQAFRFRSEGFQRSLVATPGPGDTYEGGSGPVCTAIHRRQGCCRSDSEVVRRFWSGRSDEDCFGSGCNWQQFRHYDGCSRSTLIATATLQKASRQSNYSIACFLYISTVTLHFISVALSNLPLVTSLWQQAHSTVHLFISAIIIGKSFISFMTPILVFGSM